MQVRAGQVSVPGGTDAEPLWTAIVGADPSRPAAFVQRLIRGNGRLAWFYDAVLHLDANRQNLVLGRGGSEASRVERLRELLTVFESVAPEWQIPERPFSRPLLDPGIVISLLSTADGELAGPRTRQLWETVFRDDGVDAVATDTTTDAETTGRRPIELPWLTRRIALAPPSVGRRRLETFLFAQRVFPQPVDDDANLLAAIRGAATFPALAMTLERIGVTNASTYAAAARAAAALNGIRSPEWRRAAVAEFQSAVALIDRAVRMGGLDRQAGNELVTSLSALANPARAGLRHGVFGVAAPRAGAGVAAAGRRRRPDRRRGTRRQCGPEGRTRTRLTPSSGKDVGIASILPPRK